MSVKKKIVATIIVLAIVAIATYGLFALQGSNANRGDEGGGVLGAPNVRTIITLTVVGGSAFITGFGLRDVIGRTVAARQRSRLKQAGGQSTH